MAAINVIPQTTIEITKDYILSNISQEDIFEYYLGIGKVVYNTQIKNPLRKDVNPSASFTWTRKGKLIFRDWTERETLDCFDVVQRRFNINFYEAIEKVARDFGLVGNKKIADTKYNTDPFRMDQLVKSQSMQSIIEVKTKPYSRVDIDYLKSYGITSELCRKYQVYSVQYAWLNSSLKYVFTKDTPALAYYFGIDELTKIAKWKLYFYNRQKGDTRFLQNTTDINGLEQLPETGPVLVITKSMKDVMVLASFNVAAIAPQSESMEIDPDLITELKARFPVIVTLYDFDYAGVKGAQSLKRKYGFEPLFLTNGRFGSLDYKAKDISDFRRDFGAYETEQIIKYAINYYELKLTI